MMLYVLIREQSQVERAWQHGIGISLKTIWRGHEISLATTLRLLKALVFVGWGTYTVVRAALWKIMIKRE